MAALSSILLAAVLSTSTVVAVNVVANEKSEVKLVRREVDLNANGNIHTLGDKPEDASKASQAMNTMIHNRKKKELRRSKGKEPTECDKQFLAMDEGADTCTGTGDPEEILFEGDCTHASQVLKIEKAAGDAYFMHNYKINPLPYPKGCFLNTTTNKMHFNPEESNTTGVTLTGKKICMRTKYINGTKDTDSKDGCTGDAVGIMNYNKCWAAALCSGGGGACKLQSFKDNHTDFKQETRPKGCFKDILGCWGFNYLETAPTGAINGTPVCINVVPDAQKVGGARAGKGAAAGDAAAAGDGDGGGGF